MAKRIVVVGSGFAGMWAALGAARALDEAQALGDVEVVVVAPTPRLEIRPRLYARPVEDMKAPLQAVYDAAGVRFHAGRVRKIDTARQEVEIAAVGAEGAQAAAEVTTLRYDRLVMAAGSRVFMPALPGLQEHAFSVDCYDEALELEQHLQGLASLPPSPARNTVVVVGGGFTGIETAAEMPARLRAILGEEAQVRVTVVERADAIGPDLGPGPRPVIEKALVAQGVDCKLGAAAERIDALGVQLASGERIDALTVIWTAGLRAQALTEQIPAPRDALGRLQVNRDLQVIGVPTVYVAGDAAHAATDDEGHTALMSCQHAMALGRSAGHNVVAGLLGLPSIPYSQPKYVTCLDLGPWGAVYTEGWSREVMSEGQEAKALKHQINTELIYPPRPQRDEVRQAADPRRVVVA